MKDKVKHWRSFMTFDLPLESSYYDAPHYQDR
jgi:hypothetical protein